METLRARIRSGVYGVGDLIPPESRLQAEFAISRITVRRAVDELAREGLLRKEQGRGTFVAHSPEITQPLNTLVGVTETMLAMGLTPEDLDTTLEMAAADEVISDALRVPDGAPVWHLVRVRAAEGGPVCVIDNYIRPDHVPGFSVDLLMTSLYETYEQCYGLTLERGEEIVTAGAASAADAARLGLRPGAPILVVTRTTFLDTGQPIEVAIVRSRPDRYRYAVTLTGRPG